MMIHDGKTKPSTSKPTLDYVIKACAACQQSYIAKYWDSQSACYVELNLTRHCSKCRRKGQ